MGMKAGFKQTEVGLIPEDWNIKPAHEFATIQTGPFGTLLKASEYTEHDGVPLISVGEVRNGYFSVADDTPRIPEAVTRRLPQYALREGDIVFGRKGGVDRSALVSEPQAGWFLGSDGMRLRPAKGANPEYIAAQFQSMSVQGWLLQNAIGTTMASLNQDILRRVTIPFPPTNLEQKAIAESLSDTDALISSLEQLLTKKRQIKQGAMQELLTGKRRLPGFSGSWERTQIGELLSIASGRSQKEVEDRNGSYPILATGGQIGTANRYIYDKPSVLIGRKGTIDKPQYMDTPFWTIDTLFYSIINDESYEKFIYYMFCLTDWTQHNEGSGVPSLNARTIEQIEITVPQKTEQEAIAAVLSDMDADTTVLEAKLAKARQIKQGMMQELLTGRIRLI